MTDRRLARWAQYGILALGLGTGCVPQLKTKRDSQVEKVLPKAFADQEDPGTSSGVTDWRAFFTDPNLQSLIDEALANNQELHILEQEIQIAQSEVKARSGEPLPQVGVGVDAGFGKKGSYPVERTGPRAAFGGEGAVASEFGVGLYATWELDVWKKLRNATKAALYEYMATVEGRRFAVTSLIAEIATAYYELMALDQQLAVIDANLDILRESLKVVRLQKQAARVTELAVQRFEAEVLKNESRRVDLVQRIVKVSNEINLLVGRYPQAVTRSEGDFIAIAPQPIHAGLPTEMLQNRPDIRKAEMELRAAELDVKVARATFYPSLSIDAGVGYRADKALDLLDTPESLVMGSVANLFVPLLNRRAIEANYQSANAAQIRAVYEYERAVLSAYVECATQLSLIARVSEALQRRQDQVDVLNRSIEVSIILFNSARADYLEVLTTRAEALEAQLELVETKQRQLAAVVSMYRALGGGWSRPEDTAQARDGASEQISDQAPKKS